MIFGIGLSRTGTNSLRRAFNTLGYPCLEIQGAFFLMDIVDGQVRLNTERIHEYSAYADSPIPLLYKELANKYPDSKFILTVRDFNDWADSVERMMQKPLPEGEPGRKRAVYREKIFSSVDFDRETYIESARTYNAGAVEFFRGAENFLSIHVSKLDWPPLCGFLGLPIPEEPFPHLSKAKKKKTPVWSTVRGVLGRKR